LISIYQIFGQLFCAVFEYDNLKLPNPHGGERDVGTNGRTPERRARQAKLIQQWRPWEKSTDHFSKQKISQNAYKGSAWKQLRELAQALREQQRHLGL
jgi:hypothetical protein